MSLLDRNGEGRTIETSGDGTGSSSGDSSGSGVADNRWLSPSRSQTSRGGALVYVGSGSSPLSTIVNDVPTSISSATGQRFYLGNDPFSVMSDLFLRTFGADNPPDGTQQYSVVPTQVGGGSGNTLLILLLLAGVGFAIYWFYFRG